MPNRNAKDRITKRILSNKKLAQQGRTAKQYKKWLEKNESKNSRSNTTYKR